MSAITPSAYAESATWQDNQSITYSGRTYAGPTSELMIKKLGLEAGSKVYTYLEPENADRSAGEKRLLYVLYFGPGIDVASAEQAQHRTYEYPIFKNASEPISIGTTKQAEAPNTQVSSCAIEGGLSWLICPVTNFLASMMDWVYEKLTGFLTVQPVQTSHENGLYKSWGYMRNFANVAFVIVFLIIIYSQLTSLGIDNYNIKKILPRLIVAALMVNVSYYICAIAIDISNILGYSVQDVFSGLRQGLIEDPAQWSSESTSWQNVSGAVLGGGTLAVGGFVAFAGVSTIALLLPALTIALLSVLVALIVMAARQAIIIILVILAPLAFVAYLLPNTEKWFEKWRSTFMTMLVLFPAFSVVFGGSQFAGMAIIQSASSLDLMILGMLVQVAPLFITPLLIKFGGGLLGKIAGLTNNPNKGLVDRSRKLSQDIVGAGRAKRLARPAKIPLTPKWSAQKADNLRRKREGWKAAHEGMADARWANDKRFQRIDAASKRATDSKTLGETLSENAYNASKLVANSDNQELDVRLRNAQGTLANTKVAVDVQYENLKAAASAKNIIPGNLSSKGLAQVAVKTAHETEVLAQQLANSKLVQKEEFGKLLKADTTLQIRAGGINERGVEAAMAAAINAVQEAQGKVITEAKTIMNHFNLDAAKRQDYALGKNVVGINDDGVRYEFKASDAYTREAVIETQMEIGTVDEIEQLVQLSGSKLYEFRKTISQGLAKNSNARAAAPHLSGQTIDDVMKGMIGSTKPGALSLDDLTRRSIIKGKFSEADMAHMDASAAKRFVSVVSGLLASSNASERLQAQKIIDATQKAFKGDERSTIKSNAADDLLRIARLTDPTFNPDS